MDSLRVNVQDRGGATVVSLVGSAGAATNDVLEKSVTRLLAARPHRLVLDLASLTFISSLAIGLLVTLEKNVKDHGGQVTMAAAQPEIARTFERCRLNTVMPMFPTVDAALA